MRAVGYTWNAVGCATQLVAAVLEVCCHRASTRGSTALRAVVSLDNMAADFSTFPGGSKFSRAGSFEQCVSARATV